MNRRGAARACGLRTRYGKKTGRMPSARMMGRMMLAAQHSSRMPIHSPLRVTRTLGFRVQRQGTRAPSARMMGIMMLVAQHNSRMRSTAPCEGIKVNGIGFQSRYARERR